jgi:hypothetical protein
MFLFFFPTQSTKLVQPVVVGVVCGSPLKATAAATGRSLRYGGSDGFGVGK